MITIQTFIFNQIEAFVKGAGGLVLLHELGKNYGEIYIQIPQNPHRSLRVDYQFLEESLYLACFTSDGAFLFESSVNYSELYKTKEFYDSLILAVTVETTFKKEKVN